MSVPEPIIVRKFNPQGEETWRYEGVVLQRSSTRIFLEARFNRHDTPFYEILLKQGDRFLEEFFTDRWYNIFEIHDLLDDRIKGWYCNISYPATFDDQAVNYIDLAIDLLVYPDGRQFILDMDEFEALALNEKDTSAALAALAGLQVLFRDRFREI